MTKYLLSLILLLLSTLPVSANGPYELRFPVVWRAIHPCQEVDRMGDWKVTAPEERTNYVLNPSAETTGNFAAESGTTVTRVTTFQHYGLYSYRIQTNANNEGIQFTLSTLSNAIHYITVRVRGTLPTTWDWSLNGSTFHQPTLLEELDGDWKLYGVQIPAAQASGSTALEIHQNGTGTGDFYLDGVQVETGSEWSTYCDGTQPGCAWNGAAHASSSTRSADSRAGGIVYDLEDDFGLKITGFSGTGTAPQELFIDSYASLPGGELNSRKVGSRVITLTGLISENSETEFYQTKQDLESLFDPDAYPPDENGPQPVRLRFTGATVHKEIAVHYEGGLEMNITADDPCAWERVAIRFIADDPYWYEIGESAALLDTNDTATFRTVAARLKSSGQWDELGPPHASGTYNSTVAIAEDATYIYFGGDFQNFNNIANADYIVRYNKATGAYSALGTGLNGVVARLFILGDNLYAGGNFTTAGGGAASNIAVWDGSSWAALGAGTNGTVKWIDYDRTTGLLYVCGLFTTAGGGAADYIATWNGSTWAAVGSGLGDGANTLIIRNGIVYVGGGFTTAGGNSANYIATWDGSTWGTLGTGMDDDVQVMAFSADGILYAGGDFTTASGITVNYIASWNGSTWTALGQGVNLGVYGLSFGSDGVLYAGGFFTQAGDIATADRVARWNGYSWAHLDIDFPGTPTVFRLLPSNPDPVVPQKYDLWATFTTTGTGAFAGKVSASNGGTAPAFPKAIFSRSGGTGATIQTLRNERTGQEILFDYDLLDGETLTLDLAPAQKSVTSDFVTGLVQSAVLANSDLGEWALKSGDNDITSFVSEAGSPTVTAYLLWKDRFLSQN